MNYNIPLSDMSPKLCEEWSDRNHPLTPDQFTYGSQAIVWWKGKCGHEWQAKILNRFKGTKCPYCTGKAVLKGFNDLETLRPEIAAEWSERNFPLMPADVRPYSRKKVWWKCKNGHEWQTTVHTRSSGNNCPVCSNKVIIKGLNDYATRFPKLAFEWSDRNSIKLEDVKAKDGAKQYWWKCPDCGNEYRKTLVRKLDEIECPFCSRRKVRKGFSDLMTTDPEIASEWNAELNEGWMPEDVTRKSKRFIRWNCECGHIWGCKINERTIQKKSCVICAAEFRAVLPLWLTLATARTRGIQTEINKSLCDMTFQLFMPGLNAAVECGGVSKEKRASLLIKKEDAALRKIKFFVLPISTDRRIQMNAVRVMFKDFGVPVSDNFGDDIHHLEMRFKVLRKEIVLGEDNRKGNCDMNDEMKMLLKLILAQEEETEAGQNVQPIKKKHGPNNNADPDPKREDMLKAKRELEAAKKNIAADLQNARQDMYSTHENNLGSLREIPVWEKYALTVTEASQYFHLGVKKLREIINKDKYANYLIWNGRHVYIKRKLFEEFLDKEINL